MRKLKGFCAALGLLCCGSIGLAQKNASVSVVRCATEKVIQQNFKDHPELKAAFEQKSIRQLQIGGAGTSRTSALAGPVTIPVIVHVVLPNPTIITEEQIDYLLNRLNLDYSGLNPDSANGTSFYGVRGHSLLRFTRARRTPGGQITNGIERRVGNVSIGQTTYQAIKHTAAGGLDPWNITQYYNIWVGISTEGLLGIAPAIGVGAQTETTASEVGIDGVCINALGFSNGCFSNSSYNMGRTVVHEIGHNFGLYHNFETDIAGACTAGNDFGQPTPANQTFPASLVGAASDDTPAQSQYTSDCPVGIVASNCTNAPTPPGKMYQNYMDYTADACYSMFTRSQVARMHYILETYRPGYLTTQGALPPAGFPAIDAAISSIISPGGTAFDNATCTITGYPAPLCPGAFTPRLAITNIGATTLTAVTVTMTLTGATTGTQTSTVALNNLLTNRTEAIALPNQLLNTGTTNITFTITQANGATDAYTANNTTSTSVTVSSAPLPVTQGFETTPFPPNGWRIVGNTGAYTWVRDNHGRNSAWSAKVDNFNNNDSGRSVSLQTVPFRTANVDSIILTFDVAYRPYDATSTDELRVLASGDCGTTFTPFYSKAGTALATAGSLSMAFNNPTQSQWRTERVSIPTVGLNSETAVISFQNINQFGNNIFIDNVNITGVYKRDARLLAINQPANVLCTPANTPNVTVRNTGTDTIRSFKVAYVLDNGSPVVTNFPSVSVPANTNLAVALAPLTAAVGAHTFRAYVYDLVTNTGAGDQNLQNDTLSKPFTVVSAVAAPLAEGFDNTVFPPAGWAVVNPDAATTWQRTTRASLTGSASAYINNYNYPTNGSIDELYTPQITYTGADSVFLNFDVAAATYSYPGSTAIPLDTLEILVTNNCGATFTSVYKKWGYELQTLGNPNSPQAVEFVPNRNQWRNERVNLSAFAARSPIQVVFRNTSNFENNIFIDNVNLSTKTLPAKLKEQGFLIYPTPFAATFFIQHYLPPTDLRGVAVYNSVGQRVWAREYSSTGATALLQVDLSRYANDIYTVVLRYTSRTLSQKIIKAK